MKHKLPKLLVIIFTGLLFAAYSAFNIFVVVRDGKVLPWYGVVISTVVALLFALLAVFSFTSEVKNIRFLVFRKRSLLAVLLIIFALKLRIADLVVVNLDVSKLHTVLYVGSYLFTVAALLLLFFNCAFFVKRYPRFRKSSIVLLGSSILFFLGCLAMEIILFFVYDIGLEANQLRTLVSRPIFYLSFVGLCVYFLMPMKLNDDDSQILIIDSGFQYKVERNEPKLTRKEKKLLHPMIDDEFKYPAEEKEPKRPKKDKNPQGPVADNELMYPAEEKSSHRPPKDNEQQAPVIDDEFMYPVEEKSSRHSKKDKKGQSLIVDDEFKYDVTENDSQRPIIDDEFMYPIEEKGSHRRSHSEKKAHRSEIEDDLRLPAKKNNPELPLLDDKDFYI